MRVRLSLAGFYLPNRPYFVIFHQSVSCIANTENIVNYHQTKYFYVSLSNYQLFLQILTVRNNNNFCKHLQIKVTAEGITLSSLLSLVDSTNKILKCKNIYYNLS